MKVLVINCGSSSLKYQLFEMENETVLARGLVERIGIANSFLRHQTNAQKEIKKVAVANHKEAVWLVMEVIADPEKGVLKNMQEIAAVGHRVLHAGEDYCDTVILDDHVMRSIVKNIELGPLHNPHNITGIKACAELLPGIPQVCVFDTAFHQTMPPEAWLYGIPYECYQEYKIRKYGFHGTSHRFVSLRAAKLLNQDYRDLKIITCHLGNGSSIAAIKNGKCLDTTMGLTPLEGLMMGTRSGDIDPTVVTFLMDKKGWSAAEVNEFLNKKCGLLGLSGISSDFRDVEAAAAKGHQRAQLALNRFAYMVKKYIGAYTAALNGLDVLVFTAGIGENSASMRQRVCADLEYLGLKLDPEKNKAPELEKVISAADSRIKIVVIPTNEELMIARDTYALLK